MGRPLGPPNLRARDWSTKECRPMLSHETQFVVHVLTNTARGRKTMKKWIALCIAVGCTLAASVLQAQTWPQRPVRVIVPYSAGGLSDTQARVLSERLSAAFGQQFLVENRVGATGAIAAEYVAKSPADGYTLFWATTPQISILSQSTSVRAVHISIPAKTLKEFIEYVRAHPGQLSYSSAGTGSAGHLSAALFTSRAGLTMTHIPYMGVQAATDLLGGQVQMYFGPAADLIQHSKSGKIRLLAVSGGKRAPILPDMPTIEEFYPGFRSDTWNGLMAPAATPKRIIDRIAQEVAKAARDPGVIERLNKIGVEAYANTPAEFAALIRSEAPQWRDAVNAAGIKQE